MTFTVMLNPNGRDIAFWSAAWKLVSSPSTIGYPRDGYIPYPVEKDLVFEGIPSQEPLLVDFFVYDRSVGKYDLKRVQFIPQDGATYVLDARDGTLVEVMSGGGPGGGPTAQTVAWLPLVGIVVAALLLSGGRR